MFRFSLILVVLLSALVYGQQPVMPGSQLGSLAPITSSNGTLNATFTVVTGTGVPAVLVQLDQDSGSFTTGAIRFRVSYDGTNFVNMSADTVLDPTASTSSWQIALPYTLQASTNKAFLLQLRGAQALQILMSTALTGTGSVTPSYALIATPMSQIAEIAGTPNVNVSLFAGSTPSVVASAVVVGGKSLTNTAVSGAVDPLPIAGSDYGGTPNIQSLKVDSSGHNYANLFGNAGAAFDAAKAANAPANGLMMGGSDYGGTPALQFLKVDSSGNAQVACTSGCAGGSLTNNNAAPTNNNGGVLAGLANAAAPTYTEGDQVLHSLDLKGNTRSSINDASNGPVAVKAAATSPTSQDKALSVAISPNNTGLPVNLPVVVHKAGASIGGTTVKTLTDTITSTTAGNSLILAVCAGEVANGGTIVLTITETGGSDTWTLAATQAQSTTFACSLYYATNITGGVTATIATFSGASSANTTIAMYTWEVSGLIALSPQVFDTSATGNATSTAPSAGPAQPDNSNEYAFAAFGIGTAAQTVTLGGTGTWVNDSGQVNPASASGLFSFVGASQFRNSDRPLTAAGTITSEPWVVIEALFTSVSLSVDGVVQLYDGTTNVKVIAGTNALKTDLSSVAGTATATGNGTSGAGNPRINIASDNTAFETIPVTTATTTDTASRCTLVSAASTNATNCKNAAGNVYGFRFFNTTTTVYYLRMYNSSSSPTCSSATGFIESLPVPPATASGQTGGFMAMEPFGEGYTTGISFCLTGGSSSTDNTNAATGVFGTILYK